MKKTKLLFSIISTFVLSTVSFAGPFDVDPTKEYNAFKQDIRLQNSDAGAVPVERVPDKSKRPCGCKGD